MKYYYTTQHDVQIHNFCSLFYRSSVTNILNSIVNLVRLLKFSKFEAEYVSGVLFPEAPSIQFIMLKLFCAHLIFAVYNKNSLSPCLLLSFRTIILKLLWNGLFILYYLACWVCGKQFAY